MEDLIPLAAIFCTIGLPVLGWMLFRVLAHRERMEMLRQGMTPPMRGMGRQQQQQQAAGMQMGMGTMPSSSRKDRNCKNDHTEDPPDVTLRKGIRLSMIGLGLTIGLSFIHFDGNFHPGPWLLFGLIPMFVGVGHVLIALLSGAQIGVVGPAQTYVPGPGPFTAGPIPPNPPPPPPTYDGSYTYRPGDRTELKPPLTPPERR